MEHSWYLAINLEICHLIDIHLAELSLRTNLEDEAREFKNEINQKEISLASTKSEIATKLKEIQALQSRIEELKQNVSLFRIGKYEVRRYTNQKKDELMWVKDDLLSAQKAVIEKDSFLQETNFLLLEHISKTSSESKQNEAIGGDKGLEKDNEITSPEITSESPYSLFFQHAIIFIIVLLIIYILRNQGYGFLI
uniref:Uncharacterized protein n=1 Tax=Rhizophagus irregularis (strain DAOM 181602 / DAOM 197198 / MUCL 43194) TaxID=747089 RepID=U9T0B9_RHIID